MQFSPTASLGRSISLALSIPFVKLISQSASYLAACYTQIYCNVNQLLTVIC